MIKFSDVQEYMRLQQQQQQAVSLPEDITYEQYIALVEQLKQEKEIPEAHKDGIVKNIEMQWARIRTKRFVERCIRTKRFVEHFQYHGERKEDE